MGRTDMDKDGRKVVRARQLVRSGDASLPGAEVKARDLGPWNCSCGLEFPSRVPGVCDHHGSSRRIQRATVSDGVHLYSYDVIQEVSSAAFHPSLHNSILPGAFENGP